ncbi:hypothetical protein KC799_00575 [candidate division KSB1 bacterium]|nr:hypothetical protein [candidate division KSB1 bacterium]
MLKKILIFLASVIVAVFFVFFINAWRYTHDRHPGYDLNISIDARNQPVKLQMGFAAEPITPEVPDRWEDVNKNARYEPDKGETFTDGNGNGKFDARWIAGFGNKRAANGVHDDQWARTVVVDDGNTRLAVVILDLIGFMNDEVIDVRAALPADCGIDYAIIASTHTHEAVDMLGLWGDSYFSSGIDPEYAAYVKAQAVHSVIAACSHLRPAKIRMAKDLSGALSMLEDTRKPHVFDPGLRIMQAFDAEADTTLGTLIAWANHPETLWSKNLMLSSDFPHYVRECFEKGVFQEGKKVREGLGGIAVYLNGAIGGLMTTRPGIPVADPFVDTSYTTPSFDKIRAQGQQLALLGMQALAASDVELVEMHGIDLRVKTIEIPLANPLFRLGAALGVIRRSMTSWMKVRSEVAVFRFGPAMFTCVPGEIYPEIINGGIEAPVGQDYQIPVSGNPSVRELMQGEFKFIIGLANDEVGYIIPKSEWDTEPPYLYNAKNSPYGESNSMGPETAEIVYLELAKLLQTMPE